MKYAASQVSSDNEKPMMPYLPELKIGEGVGA
jgi:hypothetical protein